MVYWPLEGKEVERVFMILFSRVEFVTGRM
jgi:hypothetical protein